MIRVLVVDDHPMVRGGLSGVIRADSALELIGEAGSGKAAIEFCKKNIPDVVLMDFSMPEMDGVAATAQIKILHPETQVVILSSFLEPKLVQGAVQAGASGYLLKTATANQITDAIRAAHAKRRALSPEATDALIEATQNNHQPGYDLTERERSVLRLMAKGASNQEIARKLEVSLATVKFHAGNLFNKLGVESRTEAVYLANKQKLISPDD